MQAYLNGKVTAKSKAKTDGDSNSLKFELEAMPQEECVLPEDVNQIPDVFINVNLTTYAPPVEGKKQKKNEEEEIVQNDRIGFIRLNAKSIIVNQESVRPTWHIVQSVENMKKNIGRLLINARLAPANMFKRQALKESKDVQYWFFP